MGIIQVYRTMGHLEEGEHGLMVGLHKGEISSTPLKEVLGQPQSLDLILLKLAVILSKEIVTSAVTVVAHVIYMKRS